MKLQVIQSVNHYSMINLIAIIALSDFTLIKSRQKLLKVIENYYFLLLFHNEYKN